MCISGNIGAKINVLNDKISTYEYLFAEDQSRYLVEIQKNNKDKVSNILKKNSIYFEQLGKTQKEKLDINKKNSVTIEELKKVNSQWFKNYFIEN